MRKNFNYWKIKQDNLTLQEAVKLYQEITKETGSIMFAIYHSWDGKFDLHRGRLIGPHDLVIEQQTFTLDEFNATDWMLLEEDREMNKKLTEIYDYATDIFNDEEFEKLNIRDRDIHELFDLFVKEMSIDDKISIVKFLDANDLIKRHNNEED